MACQVVGKPASSLATGEPHSAPNANASPNPKRFKNSVFRFRFEQIVYGKMRQTEENREQYVRFFVEEPIKPRSRPPRHGTAFPTRGALLDAPDPQPNHSTAPHEKLYFSLQRGESISVVPDVPKCWSLFTIRNRAQDPPLVEAPLYHIGIEAPSAPLCVVD